MARLTSKPRLDMLELCSAKITLSADLMLAVDCKDMVRAMIIKEELDKTEQRLMQLRRKYLT